MGDLNHFWSSDIEVSGSGDASFVDGSTESQQLIIRDICTNPGDYIWHPEYGCGAGAYVGETANKLKELKAKILFRLAAYPEILRSPVPEVTISPDDTKINIKIKYQEAESQKWAILNFDVGN